MAASSVSQAPWAAFESAALLLAFIVMAIDSEIRREFDGLSLQEMKARTALSLWPGDKLRQAREYIDEKKKNGRRRMFWVAVAVAGVGVGALLFGFYLKL
jgi:hypothetical protein